MAIDSISKHFKIVSPNDPMMSEPISTNYQLYTLPNNTMIKHHAGNRYVKVNKNIFDKVENSSLSRYDLPYELALGDKHLYMTLTYNYFTPKQLYSASAINQHKISGDMDDIGSYYCISCVTFEDKYCLSEVHPHGLEYKDYLFKALKKMKELPEMFICANDFVALDLLYGLNKIGIECPKDIKLFGFDDSPESKIMTPSLSTSHIHSQIIGYSAANLVISRIEQPNLNYRTTYTETDLIYRDSTSSKKFPQ